MSTQEQRQKLIPEIDTLTDQARQLQKNMILTLQGDEFQALRAQGGTLLAALQEASDRLKLDNSSLIESHLTFWHHVRIDDEEQEREEDDPEFYSTYYDGDDTWTCVMTTRTHGRERIVVHSNAASWYTVYSTEKLD